MLKVAWAPRLLCRNDAFAEIVADRIVELARAGKTIRSASAPVR